MCDVVQYKNRNSHFSKNVLLRSKNLKPAILVHIINGHKNEHQIDNITAAHVPQFSELMLLVSETRVRSLKSVVFSVLVLA